MNIEPDKPQEVAATKTLQFNGCKSNFCFVIKYKVLSERLDTYLPMYDIKI